MLEINTQSYVDERDRHAAIVAVWVQPFGAGTRLTAASKPIAQRVRAELNAGESIASLGSRYFPLAHLVRSRERRPAPYHNNRTKWVGAELNAGESIASLGSRYFPLAHLVRSRERRPVP